MPFSLNHTVGAIYNGSEYIKEIKDANNNTLWLRSVEYPFTKYEYWYSHSYDSGYVKINNFNMSTALVYYDITFKIDALPDSTHNRYSYLASYDARKVNDLRRLYIIIVDQTGIRCCLGNQWYTGLATADINIDHWYKVACTISQTSNKAKLNWYLYDVTNNNTQIASTTITNTVTGYCGLSATNTYIGCSAAADSSGSITYQDYVYGKVGEVTIRTTNSYGAYQHHIFPAYKRATTSLGAISNYIWDVTTQSRCSASFSGVGNIVTEYWDGN